MDVKLSLIQERWLWLAASILIALITAWIRWFITQRHYHSPIAWVQEWENWPGRPWVIQIGRLLYFVGIPALALFWRHVLTEKGLGLQPLSFDNLPSEASFSSHWRDWVEDIGWAIGITAGAGLIQFLNMRIYRHIGSSERSKPKRDLGIALREAWYYQIHWAFYREPFVLTTGSSNGAWVGLLLVALEAGLNPNNWENLRTPQLRFLNRAFLAIVGTLIYIQTQNLWLVILSDTLLALLVGTHQTETLPLPQTTRSAAL